MGFYEDDRIRTKNHASNRAHEIYTELRGKMWSRNDIAAHAEEQLTKDRKDRVAYELFKMAVMGTTEDHAESDSRD